MNSPIKLTPEEFSLEFKKAWNLAKVSFTKLEHRQSYNQTGDPSFDAYTSGSYIHAQKILRMTLLNQKEMYDSARNSKVTLERIRLITRPLSNYLCQYEIPSYLTSQRLGEDISIADITDLLPQEDYLPDCIIFDKRIMFINTYDNTGRPTGAMMTKDKNYIAQILKEITRIRPSAIKLDAWLQQNSEILDSNLLNIHRSINKR